MKHQTPHTYDIVEIILKNFLIKRPLKHSMSRLKYAKKPQLKIQMAKGGLNSVRLKGTDADDQSTNREFWHGIFLSQDVCGSGLRWLVRHPPTLSHACR